MKRSSLVVRGMHINAQNTISLDLYNTLVAEYEKETSGLIGNVLKIFAKDVEYFR